MELPVDTPPAGTRYDKAKRQKVDCSAEIRHKADFGGANCSTKKRTPADYGGLIRQTTEFGGARRSGSLQP